VNVLYKNTTTGLDIHIDLDALISPPYDFVKRSYRTCYDANTPILLDGHMYDCETKDMSTVGKRDTVRNIVNAVLPMFKKLVSVYEIEGTMELEYGDYSNDICIGGKKCLEGKTENNIVSLTDKQLYVQITMRPDDGTTYATGNSLAFDSQMRPVVGHVNFNSRLMPESVKEGSAQWQELTGVALHEMMHVLGFSNSMFPYFMNHTSGELYDQTVVTDTHEKDGHETSILVTPHVARAVQRQFGCPSLRGAPLEDQGGSGTAASHWEKAVFMDEVMTGSASAALVLSNITLALLEDSGWYFPNYSYGERLLWGENLGCDFVRASCGTGWPHEEGAGYFCTERDKEGCTYDRTARGLCSMKNYNNLPEKYRHLSDPSLGGTVILADYCPFVRPYSNGFCTDTSMQTSYITGDAAGPNSKCYMSRISIVPLTVVVDVPAVPLCYPTVCLSSERLAVKIGSYWTECPSNKTLTKVHGYFGSLDCPDAASMCGGNAFSSGSSNQEFVAVPLLSGIEPKQAKAGEKITVCGENINVKVDVKVGTDCINKKAINTSCIECEINTTSGFKTVVGPVDVVLTFGDYKTIYDSAFTVTLDLKVWAKRNAFFLFAILFSIVLFLLVLLTVIVKCHKTKKRYREYQARLRKAKAARAAKEERAARGEVEMDPIS